MDPLELMIFAPARCIICTGDHAAIENPACAKIFRQSLLASAGHSR